jgi:DNA-binding NtrC family response regulator
MRNINVSGTRAPATDGELPAPLVGVSDRARSARDEAERAVTRSTPVLVVAEPGCRAAEVAAWLHAGSRRGHPLVAVDCAEHEPADLERRLFGSPARTPMPSDLETLAADAALLAAGKGTLFLENVEELPSAAQRRLARALRDGEVRVPGGRAPVTVGCRIVAAATRELDGEVRDGRFRQDLSRRLSGCRITIPPLRQRPADFAAIVERLLAGADRSRRSFTQPAVTVLAALPWPRNFDELAGVLAKVLAASGPVIRQEDVLTHLPIDGAFARPDLTTSLREARRRFERDYIAAVLEHHQWRMRDAARSLGIERANLYRKTRQLGIKRSTRQELA